MSLPPPAASKERLLAQAAVTQGVLDAMQAQVVVLNREGRIIHKNWGEFEPTLAGASLPYMAPGGNYFEACARPDVGPGAAACLEGMRPVLRGELSHFLHDYPCGPAEQEQWFRIHVVPVHSPEMGLAVAHFNITPIAPETDHPRRSRLNLSVTP